ncbi:hypothetical protein SAMN05660666_01333 [Novosphingobium aromaticivorans]|uniref:DUF4136 domain-containing protein n=1 Tax=Novosphingobium aromaticivorans TaxID=48935 RepID=UPI0003158B76|nr:DUF4136 domain-containing protein [Novosphingobium aromaticivorans]SCY29697.1 hypothetical protein SAMN05660666_01333 [Novosphingobium aromaticivorans]
MNAKLLTCAIVALSLPATAFSQAFPGGPGGWDRGGPMMDQRLRNGSGRRTAEPSRKIEVEAFRSADAAALLGKGPITVAAAPGAEAEWKLPVYEAAVVDQLARLGYDTAVNGADSGQIAQIGVSHVVVVPEEAKKKPVSGAMEVGVSNRGNYTAMALNVDLSKAKKAIVASRLDVRIRDKASNRVLWEGHAETQTREDDDGLNNGEVAARLATALFAKFTDATEVPGGG